MPPEPKHPPKEHVDPYRERTPKELRERLDAHREELRELVEEMDKAVEDAERRRDGEDLTPP